MAAWLSTSAGRLVLVLALMFFSSTLLLRNLGDPYITLWDEAVHINVVRNLAVHCCTPQLHRQAAGTDPRDWTDNHVWLHKPPLPFFFNAAVARVLGTGVFGIRAAAYLVAQCLVLLVFLIGVTRFGTAVGFAAGLLVAFNHYTFQLVQGHQFSGLPDLALACVLTGALYLALAIADSDRSRAYLGFGALCGLAFLCKDGLGLVPFAALALSPAPGGWRRRAAGLALAACAAAIVLVPPSLYIAYRYPAEALLEQQHRVAHLIRDVEGWRRPMDYYVTVYFPRVTSPLIAGVLYLGVVYGFIVRRRRPDLAVLSTWIAAYLLVLSSSVSKISNFIYPVMPAAYLMLPAVLVDLRRTGRHSLILAAAASVIATAVLLQWNLLGSSSWVVDFPHWSARPALIALQWCLFALVAAIASRLQVRHAQVVSIASVAVAAGLVLAASARASIAASTIRPSDYEHQMALRAAARAARAVVRPEDVILVEWAGVRKPHLYVMYWSGSDSYEVTTSVPASDRLNSLPADRRVFLLTTSPVPAAVDGIPVEGGSLSRVR